MCIGVSNLFTLIAVKLIATIVMKFLRSLDESVKLIKAVGYIGRRGDSMDAALFARMFVDSDVVDVERLKEKYPEADGAEFMRILYSTIYRALPLRDELGQALMYSDYVRMPADMLRLLLTPQRSGQVYGARAIEEEICALLTLEDLEFNPEHARMMVRGMRVTSAMDKRMKALKKGMEFIGEPKNKITEKRINVIYQMVVQPFAAAEEQLLPKQYYRHKNIGQAEGDTQMQGVSYEKLPQCMADLVEFMNTADNLDDLTKAAMIHYYILYLQPYFTGNETMARLVSFLYLVQQGYPSTLFISFTKCIVQSRSLYEQTKQLMYKNKAESGVVDVTPFLRYYAEHVYRKAEMPLPVPKNTIEACKKAQDEGLVTVRQKALWDFILSAYGCDEFTETQLCSDFKHISNTTVSKFLVRFVSLGLIEKTRYSGRFKYRVK